MGECDLNDVVSDVRSVGVRERALQKTTTGVQDLMQSAFKAINLLLHFTLLRW